MGWGTTINAEIYISRVQFESELPTHGIADGWVLRSVI